jgi:hypothetical protein
MRGTTQLDGWRLSVKVGDLVKSCHPALRASRRTVVGIIVKNTPEYSTTQYQVLMGGRMRSFAARHLEVVYESR